MSGIRHIRLLALAATVALGAAACGSDSKSSSTAAPSSAAPTTAASTTAAPTTAASSTAAPTTAAAATTAPAAAGTKVELTDTKFGKVLSSDGKILYTFNPDNMGAPTCTGGCGSNWPALKAEGAVAPGAGLDAEDFSTSANPEGFDQVTFYKWPLYFFAGDVNPGDVNGQGVAGKWFVVGADGAPITAAA